MFSGRVVSQACRYGFLLDPARNICHSIFLGPGVLLCDPIKVKSRKGRRWAEIRGRRVCSHRWWSHPFRQIKKKLQIYGYRKALGGASGCNGSSADLIRGYVPWPVCDLVPLLLEFWLHKEAWCLRRSWDISPYEIYGGRGGALGFLRERASFYNQRMPNQGW